MDERALIFANLVKGVPVWQVARDYRKRNEAEVLGIFAFVLNKVRNYHFVRHLPPIVGESVEEIRKYRAACLSVLPKLNFDKPPQFKKIANEPLEMKNDGTIRNADLLGRLT